MRRRGKIEDVAGFLGRDGEIFVFDTPMDLAKFLSRSAEQHDLAELASWPEVEVVTEAGNALVFGD